MGSEHSGSSCVCVCVGRSREGRAGPQRHKGGVGGLCHLQGLGRGDNWSPRCCHDRGERPSTPDWACPPNVHTWPHEAWAGGQCPGGTQATPGCSRACGVVMDGTEAGGARGFLRATHLQLPWALDWRPPGQRLSGFYSWEGLGMGEGSRLLTPTEVGFRHHLVLVTQSLFHGNQRWRNTPGVGCRPPQVTWSASSCLSWLGT